MPDAWPPLPPWDATRDTLHRWLQVVGKVRLALAPWTNHSWHVPLYVTPRGLTSGPVPHGARLFEVRLDLVGHRLDVVTDGDGAGFGLGPMSVAAFHDRLMDTLGGLGLGVEIHGAPNEVEDATPFAEDHGRDAYDAGAVAAFGAALRQSHRVLAAFRARFTGKASPVHFFWGSFDLAASRFSGRPAPTEHPGGFPNLPDWVAREAYDAEVWSAGFWPGDAAHDPLFYAYAVPEPDGFSGAEVAPEAARYDGDLGEFVLSYEAVRTGGDEALLTFLESTYAAAVDREPAWAGLEAAPPGPARPRRLRPR